MGGTLHEKGQVSFFIAQKGTIFGVFISMLWDQREEVTGWRTDAVG